MTCAGPALGGAASNWEQFRSAQVPSQLAPRSVELGTGPIGSNWYNWLKAGPVLMNYCKCDDVMIVFATLEEAQ